MPDVGDVVKEEIGEGLPNAEKRDNSGRHQAKPFQEPGVAAHAAKIFDKGFDNIDSDVGDDEELHTRSDVKIEADAVSANGGA